jgi:hypothetical protein
MAVGVDQAKLGAGALAAFRRPEPTGMSGSPPSTSADKRANAAYYKTVAAFKAGNRLNLGVKVLYYHRF